MIGSYFAFRIVSISSSVFSSAFNFSYSSCISFVSSGWLDISINEAEAPIFLFYCGNKERNTNPCVPRVIAPRNLQVVHFNSTCVKNDYFLFSFFTHNNAKTTIYTHHYYYIVFQDGNLKPNSGPVVKVQTSISHLSASQRRIRHKLTIA